MRLLSTVTVVVHVLLTVQRIADLRVFKPKGLFKNDYLAYCRIYGIRPHPQLLPSLPPTLPPITDLPSYKAIERHDAKYIDSNPEQPQLEQDVTPHFDFTVHERVAVRGMAFGHADMLATLPALKCCKHLRSVSFSRAGLSSSEVWDLALALPHTAITELILEFNPLLMEEDEPEAPAKHRVLVPKDTLPLPPVLYPSEFVGGDAPIPAPQPVTAGGAQAARVGTPAAGSRPSSRSASFRGGAIAAEAESTVKAVAAREKEKDLSAKLITYGLPGKTGGRIWSLFFKRFQKLQLLSLRGNDMGPADAAYIADALLHNESLTSLNLSVNPLQHEGVVQVLTSLQECSAPLTFLGLASVDMPAESVPTVVNCFKPEASLSFADMRARALREDRVAAELIMDINGLGLRELMLPLVSAALDAAEASKLAAAAAAAAAADPKAKGAAKPAAGPPTGSGRVKGPHPDSDFIAAFRLAAAQEVGLSAATAETIPPAPAPAAAQSGKPSPKGKGGSIPAPAPAAVPEPAPAPAPAPVDPDSRTFTVVRPGFLRVQQLDLTGNAGVGAEGLLALAQGLAPLYPSKQEEAVPAPAAARVAVPATGAGKKGAPAAAPAPAPAPAPKPTGPAVLSIAAYSCVPALHSAAQSGHSVEEKKGEEQQGERLVAVHDYASERRRERASEMVLQAVAVLRDVGVTLHL